MKFLNNPNKGYDGILQRFIEPKGNHNSVYKIVWSKNFCLFEKRQNKRYVWDAKYDINERCLTYEAADFYSENSKLNLFLFYFLAPIRGEIIPQKLMNISNAMSMHIANVTFERIKPCRMVNNYKIDNKNRIWFLWCSSMRIESIKDKPVSINST